MANRKKYLTEFKAILCSVMACTLSDIADLARELPRTKDMSSGVAYISFSDNAVRGKARAHRHKIYQEISSPAFKKKFYQMKKIDDMKCSEFVKSIILMVGLGFTDCEIARFLLADKQTIASTRSKKKNEISDIFGRK